ncbi:MAG: TonB-dependent receptor, partial [Bacteroidota bacterium]|nr:TonB-dependent receptor [Bacteroidota bacterium]
GTYTPFDLQQSAASGYEVLDSAHAFSARNPPYVRADLNAELHINWKASTLTVYLSILNVLNIKNPTNRYVRFTNGVPEVKEDYDLPILPIVGIRFEF